MQLRPVEYRITVAAGKLAATRTSLHLTRRMLQSLRGKEGRRDAALTDGSVSSRTIRAATYAGE